MKISSRITMALIIPVIGSLLFAGVLLLEKKQVVFEISQLQKLTALVTVVSTVVHELQKERGMSALYIETKGLSFADRLTWQRHLTEENKKALLAVFDRFAAEAFSISLQGKIKKAQTELSLLDGERKDVDILKSSVTKMAYYYSSTITTLLSIVDESDALSNYAEITTAIDAYSGILQLKERAGQERAIGSVGFSRHLFRPEIYKRFVELIAEQKVFLDTFNTHATPEQKTFFAQTMVGAAVDEVERMRKIVIDSPIPGTTVNIVNSYWYDTISAKINLLRDVENRLADDLVAKAEQIKKNASNVFIITLGIVVAGFFLVTVTVFLIMRSITRPLNYITRATQQVANGDYEVDLQCHTSDEIGVLASNFIKMSCTIQEKENALRLAQEGLEDEVKSRTAELYNEVRKRKKIENNLRLGEERFRDIAESSSDWFWEMGPDLRFTFFTDSCYEIAGIDPKAFVGKTRRELTGGDENSEKWEKHLNDLDNHHPFRSFDYEIQRPDGITQFISVSGKPVFGEAGEFKGYRGTGTNITERKEIEREHKRVSLNLQSVLDNMTDTVYRTDANGSLTNVSRSAQILTGYELDELIGTKISEYYMDPDRREVFLTEMQLGRGNVIGFEAPIRHKDGHVVWVSTNAHFVLGDENNVIGVEGTIRDITEQKESELELRRSEHKLALAFDKAKEASKSKSEFLASMSHELRTPLNAVLGFAQMMQYNKDEPLMPSQKENVDIILTAGADLLNLINEVLDLATIEADRATINLDTVDAGKIITDCVLMLSPLAEKRQIKVKNMLNGTSAMLNTDAKRFKQMVVNYITNAIKYNKEGGLITIDGRITEHGFFHLSVTDTGIGIAEKNFPKVFGIFNRFEDNPHIPVEGTGVGLSVTKLLVERLAGNVGFESKIDHGSTFWLELPLDSNKNTIIWTDDLRVGVDALDADHQWLVKYTNKIMTVHSNDEDVNAAVDDFSEYFAQHFVKEEAVMRVCDYPDLEHHCKMHKKLAATLNNIIQNWRVDSSVETLKTLQEFSRELLIPHFLNEDKKYTKYAEGKEREISDVLDEITNTSNRPAETISENLESENLRSNKLETDPKKPINVIFVDDEQHVLDGLKRSLRGMSGKWNMDFVSEGEEALTLMKTKPYDIIVSDMQMPGMSGEELLGKVEQQYPSTARVVLSGHVDQDTTYRMVGSNHLFLSKPCSAELLIETVSKSISLVIANKELAFQNEEKDKRVAELVIANEEKDKRAAELVIANEDKADRAGELAIANKELATSLEKNEVLLKELHHRVKNNLTVLASMLGLQANTEVSAHTKQVLQDSERRVMIMAQIHEALQPEHVNNILSASDFLNTLITNTKTSGGAILEHLSFQIDVDDIPIDLDLLSVYGQIISELVSNCQKHGFVSGQQGNIEVSLHQRDDGGIELTVADDGKGVPEDFDIDKTQTLGLKLVKAMTAKLGGVINFDSSKGTRVQINIPEDQS